MSTFSHMPNTARQRILSLVQPKGYVTARAVSRAGIHTQELTRLVADEILERVGPGRYRLASAEISEHHGLVLAAAAAPGGVICLLSALALHGIGSQLPAEVWLALERGCRPPKVANLRLRIVRFSGPAFHEGIEVREIERHRVRVYSVAKTIADIFKARNRVGLDIAVEALREAWRDRRFTMADLDRAARACRVERVMRPYLEGVVA
ncbi:MAG: type IV toxin-antitoxin system AbiEi family antitoxin domain-containing protein [Deltaproteobacteria bacterium]|nr:type IV toxin-antitoxin system AbiEi family antitoxin domain-containing protein [Deltaproteobacteria bacterium]